MKNGCRFVDHFDKFLLLFFYCEVLLEILKLKLRNQFPSLLIDLANDLAKFFKGLCEVFPVGVIFYGFIVLESNREISLGEPVGMVLGGTLVDFIEEARVLRKSSTGLIKKVVEIQSSTFFLFHVFLFNRA